MKSTLFLVTIIVVGFLFSSCSSGGLGSAGILGPAGPTDAEARRIILESLEVTDVVIKDKQPCELSANTRAQGVSQRWIITFDAVRAPNMFTGESQQMINARVTISQYNGEWIWSNAVAHCGN